MSIRRMLVSRRIFRYLISIFVFLWWTTGSSAAGPPPSGPQQEGAIIYVVQPGDTVTRIANRFNLTVEEIARVNNLANPNLIFSGQRLTLPGVPPADEPAPETLPAGLKQSHLVQPDETLSKIAAQYGVSVEALLAANNLSDPSVVEIGQSLVIPEGSAPAPGPWPDPFVDISLSEPTIIQGRTLVIEVTVAEFGATLSGALKGAPVFFSGGEDYGTGMGRFWGMAAIHALAEPGTYPIYLTMTEPDGNQVKTQVDVTVVAGSYGRENILLDEERKALLDPELVRIEMEKLTGLWSQRSPRQRWAGPFRYPIDPGELRITSAYGVRRTYNNAATVGFHGGVDFGGGPNVPIYAPAAGKVMLAETLTVRGNAVLIDHGLGLYSGYWHQSRLAVQVGQEIQAGDLIGYIGSTGLVTGPHLHWEVRLNGVAVEPLQWIQQAIP